MEKLKKILPSKVSFALDKMTKSELLNLSEIRLRVNQPVYFYMGTEEYAVDELGLKKRDGYIFTDSDAEKMWRDLCDGSPYSTIKNQKEGYITVNGNRVGFSGKFASVDEEIKHIEKVSSFCVRIMHEKKGCANKIYKYLYENNELMNTLIVSPPGCGKTTLLRDVTRLLSFDGNNVALIDERDEIAAVCNGYATLDVGKRTDIYLGMSKKTAIENMIRAMHPDVVVSDELFKDEDILSIKKAKSKGIKLVATAHGRNINDVLDLFDIFDRYVFLSKRFGLGTVEGVFDKEKKDFKICC